MRRLIARMHADEVRRREALKNVVGSGLVVVRCEVCSGPIATTKVDRDKGEPPVLLDFPDNAKGWKHARCRKFMLLIRALSGDRRQPLASLRGDERVTRVLFEGVQNRIM